MGIKSRIAAIESEAAEIRGNTLALMQRGPGIIYGLIQVLRDLIEGLEQKGVNFDE